MASHQSRVFSGLLYMYHNRLLDIMIVSIWSCKCYVHSMVELANLQNTVLHGIG